MRNASVGGRVDARRETPPIRTTKSLSLRFRTKEQHRYPEKHRMSDQPGNPHLRPPSACRAEDVPANRAVREKQFSFDRKGGAQLRAAESQLSALQAEFHIAI